MHAKSVKVQNPYFNVVWRKRVIFTLHYKAAQGVLATGVVILNHGQVKRVTPELPPSSSDFNTTPTGGRLSIDSPASCEHISVRWVFSGTRLELMTACLEPDTFSIGYCCLLKQLGVLKSRMPTWVSTSSLDSDPKSTSLVISLYQ
ncbi:hypothetical protein TNCV_148801 [Trichonephila clavipes]|nr:hypothetical protein TNCV_148801 [Trichonephila clavipes]